MGICSRKVRYPPSRTFAWRLVRKCRAEQEVTRACSGGTGPTDCERREIGMTGEMRVKKTLEG